VLALTGWIERRGYALPVEGPNAIVFETVTRDGAEALRPFDRALRWSYAYDHVRALFLRRFPSYGSEVLKPLAPDAAREEGKIYVTRHPIVPPDRIKPAVQALRVIAWLGLGMAIIAAAAPIWQGAAISLALVGLLFGGFEAYQRANGVFHTNQWPGRHDPVAGFLFTPNAEVRFTNNLDYWTVERTNSLGFLDNEPAIPKPAGRFRVLLIGDSFVEAAQLPNRDKLQTLLRDKLEARLGKGTVDVVAMGYSGTGQANQLGFYDKFGTLLAPDLVLLLIVSNDFADNSPLLSALRNGWDPEYPPRPFFARDGDGFRRIAVDPQWDKHALPGKDPAARFARLKSDPAIASRLGGWDGPDRTGIDEVFGWHDLPPLFADAVLLSAYALATWKELAARDGFKLALVATEELGGARDEAPLRRERFRAIASSLGLPFLDLRPYFASQGDPADAHWRFDGHWNAHGHRWAAEAVAAFLLDSKLMATRRAEPARPPPVPGTAADPAR
jgi:hypothetical protein